MQLYPNALKLQCWPSGVSATYIGFGMAAASPTTSGSQRLIATFARVSSFWCAWDWGREFLVCNFDSLIFLKSLVFSFLNLILLSSSLVYFLFISYRESYNSAFLLVNLPLVLFISLSKTSSSYTCLNNWLIFWDLGLLDEASATGSLWASFGVGDGNSSCPTVT